MSKVPLKHNQQIDMFEFFQMLWDGKWLISAFVALASLIGFVYSQVDQPQYKFSVPYFYNINSANAEEKCKDDINCKQSEDNKNLLFLLGNNWSIKNQNLTLSFSTFSPLEKSQYEAQIHQANIALTNKIYVEAKAELTFIKTIMNDALMNKETVAPLVASNFLKANRIIKSIDNGQSAISFGSVTLVKASPKIFNIFLLSVTLGGIIGILFILIPNTIKKHK